LAFCNLKLRLDLTETEERFGTRPLSIFTDCVFRNTLDYKDQVYQGEGRQTYECKEC